MGAALAIRRTAFQAVGGFDEAFFMYGEEVDLCRRLGAAGFEIHYAPVTTVVHLGGASTAASAQRMRRERMVAGRRYLLRHESQRRTQRALGVMRTIVFARLVRDAVRMRLAREAQRRGQLRSAVVEWKELLGERELWSP
jgi:N-acetylglucosaminyl-diphospho-decaprenol L-rhamnosyltransferase